MNLPRIDLSSYQFFTLGYSGRDIDQFLNVLKKAKVKTLLDIRRVPHSMYKPDFNKKNLNDVLSKNDIKYVHLPELGVPKEIMAKLGKSGDWGWGAKWYDENIISRLGDLVDFETFSSPIALMCVELDPTKCHRHRIAIALEEQGWNGIDL